jgi:hypothetical protein
MPEAVNAWISYPEIEEGTTPKFKFKGVLGNTSVSYEDIVAPVDFLECLKLIHKVFILDGVNNHLNMNFKKKDTMM